MNTKTYHPAPSELKYLRSLKKELDSTLTSLLAAFEREEWDRVKAYDAQGKLARKDMRIALDKYLKWADNGVPTC